MNVKDTERKYTQITKVMLTQHTHNTHFLYVDGDDTAISVLLNMPSIFDVESKNTSKDFKKYSLENIVTLTRFSICSIYDIEFEDNINTHTYPIQNAQQNTDVMVDNIELNLGDPELIAVPSRSDTMPIPISTMSHFSSAPSNDYSASMDKINVKILN